MSIESAMEEAMFDFFKRFLESSDGEEIVGTLVENKMEDFEREHNRSYFHFDSEEAFSAEMQNWASERDEITHNMLREPLQDLLREYTLNFPGLCSFGLQFREAIETTVQDWIETHQHAHIDDNVDIHGMDAETVAEIKRQMIPPTEQALGEGLRRQEAADDVFDANPLLRYVVAEYVCTWDGGETFMIWDAATDDRYTYPAPYTAVGNLRLLTMEFVNRCDTHMMEIRNRASA